MSYFAPERVNVVLAQPQPRAHPGRTTAAAKGDFVLLLLIVVQWQW